MAINVLRDPLQGYDIRVQAVAAGQGLDGTQTLVGAFNTFMWRVVNQTETYLPLNMRIPRMLDGEVMTVWSTDQGMVNFNTVENAFGNAFKMGYERGRKAIIPRSRRFDWVISGQSGVTADFDGLGSNDYGFNRGGPTGTLPNMLIKLRVARVDTMTFGVAPGRAIVANSFQGTAEGCDDNKFTI